MVADWKHAEEKAGAALADEVIFVNRSQLIGDLFRKGFLDRLRERLNDDHPPR
jgi:hypothetical protein